MSDVAINCKATTCYWNVGIGEKDNCARGEVDILHTCVCQSYVTKEAAERRIKVAMEKDLK